MNADQMGAGRALDGQVAAQVFGYTTYSAKAINPTLPDDWFQRAPDGSETFVPAYSTDIAAAWLLAEELHARGYDVAMQLKKSVPGVLVRVLVKGQSLDGEADTAALAICRATLKAISA